MLGDQSLAHSALTLQREADASSSLDFDSFVRCQSEIPSCQISFFSSGGRSSYWNPGRLVSRSRRFASGSYGAASAARVAGFIGGKARGVPASATAGGGAGGSAWRL